MTFSRKQEEEQFKVEDNKMFLSTFHYKSQQNIAVHKNQKHATKLISYPCIYINTTIKNFCTSEIGIGWICGLRGTEVEVE